VRVFIRYNRNDSCMKKNARDGRHMFNRRLPRSRRIPRIHSCCNTRSRPGSFPTFAHHSEGKGMPSFKPPSVCGGSRIGIVNKIDNFLYIFIIDFRSKNAHGKSG
jgi:hypothetical protein